ncbi:hypothetical protein EJ02DRAFT_495024 [Clathrospora elynae]|uniref:Uncharacterized protein n=1 Tax=Clathrospora elynae TaxID=706981 RepID=A0A6A5SLS1_9PLEO|nr:hypothetical protein EJ02DRAFT_495024 [Clathrospora elynae]
MAAKNGRKDKTPAPARPLSSDRKLRIELIGNIKEKWNINNNATEAIPTHIQNGRELVNWDLSMLQTVSDLANDSPEKDGLEMFRRVVEQGYQERVQEADEPKGLQQADLIYVRDYVDRSRAKTRMDKGRGKTNDVVEEDLDEEMAPAYISDAFAGSKRGRSRGAVDEEDIDKEPAAAKPNKKQRLDVIQSLEEEAKENDELSDLPQEDAQDDQPRGDFPDHVLPVDDEKTKHKKWKRGIEYYWGVQDSKDIVPEDMRPTTEKGVIRRKELEKYGKGTEGVILKALYDLAHMTSGNRKGAWAQIRAKFDKRTGKKKALAFTDIDAAINFFKTGKERGEEEENEPSPEPEDRQPSLLPVAPSGLTRCSKRKTPRLLPRHTSRPRHQLQHHLSRSRPIAPDSILDLDMRVALNSLRAAETDLATARDSRDIAAFDRTEATIVLADHRRAVNLAEGEVSAAYKHIDQCRRRAWEATHGGDVEMEQGEKEGDDHDDHDEAEEGGDEGEGAGGRKELGVRDVDME